MRGTSQTLGTASLMHFEALPNRGANAREIGNTLPPLYRALENLTRATKLNSIRTEYYGAWLGPL